MNGKNFTALMLLFLISLLVIFYPSGYFYNYQTWDIWQIVDFISQILILLMGVSTILMISCFKNKWGNVMGLAHQPFWYFTTLYHEQWFLFLMSLVHTLVWSIGIWRWFYKNKPSGDN